LVCWVSMAVSIATFSRRDETWAHRKRCLCQSVDVGRTATVSAMVVALRARSRRSMPGDILLARLWLRLQAISKDGVVVVGRRVVEAGFESAKLGDGGRQGLDVNGGRSRGATRPHVSFGALEAAVMRRLREHGLFAAVVRLPRPEVDVRRWRARRRRVGQLPPGTVGACDSEGKQAVSCT
jgi:hypothetical protein